VIYRTALYGRVDVCTKRFAVTYIASTDTHPTLDILLPINHGTPCCNAVRIAKIYITNDMAAKALWYVKDGRSLKTFCKTWENVPLEKSFQG
jgi:hypothetical protein